MHVDADPNTKKALLDRLLMADFDGDLRSIAKDGKLKVARVKPHVLKLHFGDSDKAFLLEIHTERGPMPQLRKGRLGKKAKGKLAKAPVPPKAPVMRRYPEMHA